MARRPRIYLPGALYRYLHLNPVRAGVVEDPEKYPWSGHRNYLGKGEDDLVDWGRVLSQFSKKRFFWAKVYRQFVLEGMHLGQEDKYYQVKDQRYLGRTNSSRRWKGLGRAMSLTIGKCRWKTSYWKLFEGRVSARISCIL
jgi:hypothetical protein